MRNQVFNRDSQGPSIHRHKAGTYSGDGFSVSEQMQEKKREGVEEKVSARPFVRVRATCPRVLRRTENEENLVNPQRTMSGFAPSRRKKDHPDPCEC